MKENHRFWMWSQTLVPHCIWMMHLIQYKRGEKHFILQSHWMLKLNKDFTLDFSDLKTEVLLKDVFTFVQLLQSVLVGFILWLNHYKKCIKQTLVTSAWIEGNNNGVCHLTVVCRKKTSHGKINEQIWINRTHTVCLLDIQHLIQKYFTNESSLWVFLAMISKLARL